MIDLKSSLANNYANHPAFHFDQPSLVVLPDLLGTFNATFDGLRQMGSTLERKSFEALLRSCLDQLERIFATLLGQTEDLLERVFLTELHNNCCRLTIEELHWYSKPVGNQFAELNCSVKQANAMCMQTQRHFFGRLSALAVDKIRALAEPEISKFQINAKAGRLKREDLSVNGGPIVRAIRRILNQEFKSQGVLDSVGAYAGHKLRVVGLALELSVPQATWWNNAIPCIDRDPRTLYAHLDETITCPKSIVYLTDVALANGPTGCYPAAYEAMHLNPLQELVGRIIGAVGNSENSPLHAFYAKQYHQSSNSENFRRHFMRLPESMRFNSHLGWDVMPDSELERQLEGIERKMIGPVGTFIAFDGARLLHRGGLMECGERVALQVIFSDLTFTERILSKVKRMIQ